MANIEIYTKNNCPYCHHTKALLRQKGVNYQNIAINSNQSLREVMIQRSRRTKVPQIFIDQKYIGGCDDLFALDRRGNLDPLLK